jgi:hypothetical protein
MEENNHKQKQVIQHHPLTNCDYSPPGSHNIPQPYDKTSSHHYPPGILRANYKNLLQLASAKIIYF